MFRMLISTRLLSVLLVLTYLGAAAPAVAGLIQLTGSSPVVISDDVYGSDSVSVYQSAPVTLLSGADIGGFLIGYQFSRLDIQDGHVGAFLHAYTQSDVLLSGGTIDGDVVASEVASIVMSGGTVGGSILAEGSADIQIFGSDFRVDGVPVPIGTLLATSGLLTGTLDSGEALSNLFIQGESGPDATYTGSIILVPEPDVGLLALLGTIVLALGRRPILA